jgi:nucleoid DNA-binding protein
MKNKELIVKTVASNLGITQKRAYLIVDSAIDVLTDLLSKRDSISFHGLGTLSTKTKEQYQARIPSTGEKVMVPTTTKAKFKMSKKLKSSINA